MTTARDHGRRPDGADRAGAARGRRAWSTRTGPFAVGMSGEDAHLFTAERRDVARRRRARPTSAWSATSCASSRAFVLGLLDDGLVPVVSSVASADDGTVFNVNADTAAAALAVALGAEKLVVLTDVEGLYADWPASDEVVSELTADELAALLPTLSSRHDPEDGGVPARGARRGAQGARHRRPGAALAAARAVHRRRRRHPGGAMTDDHRGQVDCPHRRQRDGAVARALAVLGDGHVRHAGRWSSRPAAVRGSSTSTGASTWTWSAGSRSTSSATRTRPSSRRSAARSPRSATRRTSWSTVPPSSSPSGCWPCSAATGRVFFCNSGAEANETALKLSRRTGADRGRRRRGLASTAGPPARSRSPASRPSAHRSSRCCPVRPSSRTATWRRCGRRRTAPPRPCCSSRCWARAASCPPRPATCAAADAIAAAAGALLVARRGADRDRPHRGLVRAPGARTCAPTS